MTPKQYKTALQRVGLSINNAGDFLGFSRRQSFRIASGDGEVPESAAKLLKMMMAYGLTAENFNPEVAATPRPHPPKP